MTSIRIPCSFFGSVQDRIAFSFERWSWDEVVELFDDAARTPTATKEDAFLLAPVEFEGGRRLKKHALRSGMVILDVDSGLAVDEATQRLQVLHLCGMLYTTASHRPDHHKFRVCVPLVEEIEASVYPHVWSQLNDLFDQAADPTKKGAESLFYLPGDYQGTSNQFLLFNGDDYVPAPVIVEEPTRTAASADRPSGDRASRGPRTSTQRRMLTREDVLGRSIHENPLVTERTLDDYLDTADNWYHARYRAMCRIAGRAKRFGYLLAPRDLLEIFNEIDQLDGSYYSDALSQAKLLADAERAIGFAG